MAVVSSLFTACVVIINIILDLYVWLLIIGIILSWLVSFDVVNPRNRLVHAIGDFYFRLSEPLLRPIRRFIPMINGIDLSPLVLFLGIKFIQIFLQQLVMAL